MAATIDMQLMRYINLFSKISRVPTKHCFVYNNHIIFAVPKSKVSIAIGKDAVHVKKIRDILRRPIKVVEMPGELNSETLSKFIGAVVDPVEFNKVELREGSLTLTAGRQSKAALIGRNRAREKELSDILKDYFGIRNFRIA